jgi:O-antigen/teichoic acid export membrane protein
MTVIVGAYVARHLGPEQFGILNYAVGCVAFLTAFANLGLDEVIVRHLVLSPDEKDIVLGTAFVMKILGFFFFGGIFAVLVAMTSTDKLSAFFILIVSMSLLFQSYSVIECFFQSKVAARHSSRCKIFSTLIGSTTRIALIGFQAPLMYFAAAFVLDSIVLAIFLATAYKAHYGMPLSCRFNSQLAAKMLFSSFPLMLSALTVMVYTRIDLILIKQMSGAEAVGVYSAAMRLCEAFNFIPVAICTSLFPAMVKTRAESETDFTRHLQRLYDIMVIMAVGISIPLVFLSDHFIVFLYGAPYAKAAEVLKISAFGNIFLFLGVASGKWLMVENYTKHALLRTSCGAIANILLNFSLIPHYSIYGAAVSSVAAQFVAAYAYDALNRDMRSCFWMKTKSLFPIRMFKEFMR